MKSFVTYLAAVILGTGLGITTGWLRNVLVPWEGLPVVEESAEKNAGSNAVKSPNKGPTPKVEVDQVGYDFGSLDIDQKGRHEFLITNRGDAPLILTKGETTCHCTVSDLEKSKLTPGESTKIIVSWRPSSEPGPYQQSATFYTNDPTRPQVTFTVCGNITASLLVRPAVLIMNSLLANEPARGSVSVLSFREEPLEIKNQRFEANDIAKYFEIALSPLTENDLKTNFTAKSGFLLSVTVKPGLPQGAFQQRIILSTNNPNKPELDIPIQGAISQDISLVGPGWDSEHESLYLGTVKSDSGQSRRLLIITRGPYRKEVQYKLTEKMPTALSVSLGETTEINNGQIFQTPLFIEIPKGSPSVGHLGVTEKEESDVPDPDAVILIDTTHPEIPKIRIPVRYAVEK